MSARFVAYGSPRLDVRILLALRGFDHFSAKLQCRHYRSIRMNWERFQSVSIIPFLVLFVCPFGLESLGWNSALRRHDE
jgi:hypothetical protein